MERNKNPDGDFSPAFLLDQYAKRKGLVDNTPKKRGASGSSGKRLRQPSSGISPFLQDLIDGRPSSNNITSKEINNDKTNDIMGGIKNYGGTPKTDDEIMREAEHDRIMKGDPDVSKDYFPMLALGVYFDKINYQKDLKRKVSHTELMAEIKSMSEHLLRKYLVGKDQARINEYLRKRASGEDFPDKEEEGVTVSAQVPQAPKVEKKINKTTLRERRRAELVALGMPPSFVLRVVTFGFKDSNRLSDNRLIHLKTQQDWFLKSLGDGGQFEPQETYYKLVKDGKYLDIVKTVKAHRCLDTDNSIENLEKVALMDISEFVFTEAQIREIALSRKDGAVTPEPPVQQEGQNPVIKPETSALQLRHYANSESNLRNRRLQELKALGKFGPGFIYKIMPSGSTSLIRITDSRLEKMQIEQEEFWVKLKNNYPFTPSELLYYKLDDGRYLDMVKIIKAHRNVENEEAIAKAASFDIKDFIFSEDDIREIARTKPGLPELQDLSGKTLRAKKSKHKETSVPLEPEKGEEVLKEDIIPVVQPEKTKDELKEGGPTVQPEAVSGIPNFITVSFSPSEQDYNLIKGMFDKAQGKKSFMVEYY